MKPLRRLFDRLHPIFDKGGKLERFYPLYEAIDTFLFTPGTVTRRASHVRDGLDLKRMMVLVVVALIPCIFMAFWNTGYQANLVIARVQSSTAAEPTPTRDTPGEAPTPGAPGWRGAVMDALGVGYNPRSFLSNVIHGGLYFIPVFLVCNLVGGFWEVLFATIRRHEVNEGFLVTGMLFPLILPPTIPLWQVALGITFGVVVGKEIFGGTGRNFLNPALTARVFLFFNNPGDIVGDEIWVAADGFSGATPLGALAVTSVETGMQVIDYTWLQAFLGTIPGSMGETSTLACILGAIMLIATGIGSWRIMLSMLLATLGFSAFLYWAGSANNPMFQMPPHWHLVTGGFAFGLVFMATDPVSATMTDTGKWYFGAFIGVMTIIIRVINPAFPEGVMLAILLGNVFAPIIDYFVVQANIKRRLARNAA
jgi:Na+-transporting NADH:ubiquinone oxidoreductase subunit B